MRTSSGVVLKRFYQIVVILVMIASVSMSVKVQAQSNDGDLIKAVATEAAQSLGWGTYDTWMDGSRLLVELRRPNGILCGEYGSVGSEVIRIEAWSDEGSAARTHDWPLTFHEYPAADLSYMYDQDVTWRMGRFILTARAEECALDNFIEIPEALYAAAVAHNLGVEAPQPAVDTPTPAPLEVYTLQGTVTDGYNNPIRYAKVRLTFGVNEQFTVTDANGRYQFTDLPGGAVAGFNPAEDAYRVTVFLQYAPDGGTPLYQVLYGSDTGPVIAPVSRAFSLDGSARALKYDLNFGSTSDWQVNLLENIDQKLPSRLADLATMYVHTSQAIDLADQLDQKISHPFNVVAFTRGQSGACWHGRNSNGTQDWNHCLNLSNQQYGVAFGEPNSVYNDWSRPLNREWHELGHHFLADAFGGLMPSHSGRQNHQGYYVNARSTDAWTEGFAEFFALMVGRQVVGDPNFMEYEFGASSVANLELNFRVWDREEFATAGLLLDLVDDADDYPSAKDDDQISETVDDVWAIISKGASTESDGNGHIFDMVDLYNNLAAWGVGSEDLDKNGRADLNDVFIAHGFFDDVDGDGQYTNGDRIGYTSHPQTTDQNGNQFPAMPDRRDAPDIPGAYIASSVTIDSGIAVEGAAFRVDVLLDPPNDYLNLSYIVPMEALYDGRLYMILPPPQYSSHIRIAAIADGYQESDPFEMTGADFWSKVPNESDPPLQVHTFVLKPQKTQTLPVALIGFGILGLCGVGGIFVVGIMIWMRRPSAGTLPKKNIWTGGGLLMVLVAGMCCMIVGFGGWLIWQGKIPVPMTPPVNLQPVTGSTALPQSLAPSATFEIPPATASSSVLFQDDFSDPDSGWDDIRQGDEYSTYYFNDSYVFMIYPASYHAWANPYKNFVGDMQVEVDAQKVSGSIYDEFGVTCRYTDNSDGTSSYYYFAITVDGLGVIYKVDHGEKGLAISNLQKARSDVIHPDDQVNRIRADCVDERLSLYVNNEFLIAATDSSFRSGDVGLRVDSETGNSEIHFDNLIVYRSGQ